MSKSEVIANFSKKKQIKGGDKIGIFFGNDGSKGYEGKAVFDDGKGKFLGKFIDYYGKALTYLPAGLQDKESNYKMKNISPVYFKQKLSVNKILGITSRNLANPDNFVDYDEYLKKSGIAMVEDDEDDYDFGVERVVEEKNPVRTIGGKTKRRKQNRRTNQRRKNRTKRM